jgi:hypothetical protein
MLDTPRNPCQARPAAGFDRANQLVPEVPVSRENSNLPTFIESGLTRSAQRVWQAPAGCGRRAHHRPERRGALEHGY